MVKIIEKRVGRNRERVRDFKFNMFEGFQSLTVNEYHELIEKLHGDVSFEGPKGEVKLVRIGERLYHFEGAKPDAKPDEPYILLGEELPTVPFLMEKMGTTREESIEDLIGIIETSVEDLTTKIGYIQKIDKDTRKVVVGDVDKAFDKKLELEDRFFVDIDKHTVVGVLNRAILAYLMAKGKEHKYDISEVA